MENENLEQLTGEPEIKSENAEGSIYGKFKDAQSLLDAYNSLQSEFTRKSQKLADLQKQIDNNLPLQSAYIKPNLSSLQTSFLIPPLVIS